MWRIPLSDLNFDQREQDAVREVLESGWLTMGPRTQEFETWFASHHQAAYAVAVANCTCALELTYRYIFANSEPGCRAVIVPDITFVATANAVISAGGVPVLCDIKSPDAPYLSLEKTEKILQTRDDIAAVALVHYAGHDAAASAFAELCDKYGVLLVEDCAHSPGALTGKLEPLGTVGFAGCFSFFSNKNLATGEGGMILTDDEDFRNRARLARNHGLTSGTWSRHVSEQPSYDVKLPGHNFRCTEITAALGLAQLAKLPESNARRRELTTLYAECLADIKSFKIVLPPEEQFETAACHILSLLSETTALRDRVAEVLTREEIQTSHHYKPIHAFSYYAVSAETGGSNPDDFQNANSFASRQLTLPLYPGLKEEQVVEITDIIKSAVP